MLDFWVLFCGLRAASKINWYFFFSEKILVVPSRARTRNVTTCSSQCIFPRLACMWLFLILINSVFSPHLYTFFALAGINNLHTMSQNCLGYFHQASCVQYILGLCVRIDFLHHQILTLAWQTVLIIKIVLWAGRAFFSTSWALKQCFFYFVLPISVWKEEGGCVSLVLFVLFVLLILSAGWFASSRGSVLKIFFCDRRNLNSKIV